MGALLVGLSQQPTGWVRLPYCSPSQQQVPVVRRMAAFQHFVEHPVGIVAALEGAPGVRRLSRR